MRMLLRSYLWHTVLVLVASFFVVAVAGMGAFDRSWSPTESANRIATDTESEVSSTCSHCARSPKADTAELGDCCSENRYDRATGPCQGCERSATTGPSGVVRQGPQRESTEQFMLMMQGMAGIGPEDSHWVSSKLFKGFIPAPMPCCDLPGIKSEAAEHQCCVRQKLASSAAAATEKAERAFVHFGRQFGLPRPLAEQYLRLGIAPS